MRTDESFRLVRLGLVVPWARVTGQDMNLVQAASQGFLPVAGICCQASELLVHKYLLGCCYGFQPFDFCTGVSQVPRQGGVLQGLFLLESLLQAGHDIVEAHGVCRSFGNQGWRWQWLEVG